MLVVDSSSSSSQMKEKVGQFPTSRRVCFSFAAYAKNVISHLRMCHIPIWDGLCDEEFSKIEGSFGFTFPPDLRSILQEGLPSGAGFPQWRAGSHAEIRAMLDLPIAALCREVGRGRFWSPEWGTQPAQLDDALQAAAHALTTVPTLVPIYGNCYISCFPVQAGNPIFLVQETTILYCGYDIADFFKRQAFVPRQYSVELCGLQSQMRETDDSELNAANQWMKRSNLDNQGVVAASALNNEGVKPYCRDNQSVKPYCGNNQGFESITGDNQWNLSSRGSTGTRRSEEIVGNCVGGIDYEGKGRDNNGYKSSAVGIARHEEMLGASYQAGIKINGTEIDNQGIIVDNKEIMGMNARDSMAMWRWEGESPRVPELHADGGNAPSSMKENDGISMSKSQASDHQREAAIAKKYLYFHEKPLPSRMLKEFTMAAPPWAAKQARKIEFWSDVAEVYRIPTSLPQAGHCIDQYGTLEACNHKALQHPFAKYTYCLSTKGTHTSDDNYTVLGNGKATTSITWLSKYLDGLAEALRIGRWGEADIIEMLLQGDSSHIVFNYKVDQAGLQSCLKRAGWSHQDTLQMFSF